MRYSIPLVFFLLILVLLGFGLRHDPALVPSPLIGKPVPAFTLPTVQDPQLQLSSADLRGQVTMLNVWASWCEACRTEHPLLVQLAETDTVTIYGLNYKDDRQKALGWLREYGNPYRLSAFDQNGRTGIDFGVYGVPETYVLDRDGIIRYKHIGPVTLQVLKETMLPLIEKLESPAS